MTLPVLIETHEGRYIAKLLGAPEVRAEGENRLQAMENLRIAILRMTDRGELTTLEVEPRGILALAGKYRDDPTLREIVDEAYKARDRDAEVAP
jgi:hypothetical protein